VDLKNYVEAFHQNEFKELLKEKSKVTFCHNEYEPSSNIVEVNNYQLQTFKYLLGDIPSVLRFNMRNKNNLF